MACREDKGQSGQEAHHYGGRYDGDSHAEGGYNSFILGQRRRVDIEDHIEDCVDRKIY